MDTTKPADDALIGAYLEGDVEAFGSLYDRYARRVLRFVLSLGATREQAEESVQATWLKVVENLPKYKARGRFRAWLFQIAHRTWLDLARSAWERRRVPMAAVAENETVMASPETALDAEDRRNGLHAALETLPDAMRQVILLRLDGEMTYREIAVATGSPLGTTLWRAREATRRLKQVLEDGS